MRTLNQVIKDKEFLISFHSVVEMLVNVSLSQYHNLEKTKRKRFDTFLEAFTSFFKMIHITDTKNPLIHNVGEKQAIIVITSDSGLMGWIK